MTEIVNREVGVELPSGHIGAREGGDKWVIAVAVGDADLSEVVRHDGAELDVVALGQVAELEVQVVVQVDELRGDERARGGVEGDDVRVVVRRHPQHGRVHTNF